MVITMAKLRMAHASTHGARKPPGPKFEVQSHGTLLDIIWDVCRARLAHQTKGNALMDKFSAFYANKN